MPRRRAGDRAIGWLAGLGQRQFVGTESRLLAVFELLRQLAEGTEVDPAPRIDLAMDRPLYTPPFKARFAATAVVEGDGDLPADALFDQVHDDRRRLLAQIRHALQTRRQVSLAELAESYPIRQGLSELVAYLSLAAEDRAAVIDDRSSETLVWVDGVGIRRRASLPLVIFTQRPRDAAAS
jgi:hypothetical protein